MKADTMKVRDFIGMDLDIDVVDDYDESCYVAFCGSMALTEEGEKQFADVLDCDITVIQGHTEDVAIVHVTDHKQAVSASRFFRSAAGFCTVDEFESWFTE